MKKRLFSLAIALVAIITVLAVSCYASPLREYASIAEDSDFAKTLASEDGQSLENISIELIDLDEPFPHDGGMIRCLGPISTKQALLINGEVNYLLCTFDDPMEACENVKKEIPALLLFMQEGFGLPDFSFETWEKYAKKIFEVNRLDNYDADSMIESEVFFGKFVDIIENQADNEATILYTQQRSTLDLERLALMLPSP